MKEGAVEVYVACAHPVFAGDCVKKLQAANIKEVVVTNTINLPAEKKFRKLKVLSVAKLIASSIKAIHEEKSVSALLNPAK